MSTDSKKESEYNSRNFLLFDWNEWADLLPLFYLLFAGGYRADVPVAKEKAVCCTACNYRNNRNFTYSGQQLAAVGF